jgi:hypothetical protein
MQSKKAGASDEEGAEENENVEKIVEQSEEATEEAA